MQLRLGVYDGCASVARRVICSAQTPINIIILTLQTIAYPDLQTHIIVVRPECGCEITFSISIDLLWQTVLLRNELRHNFPDQILEIQVKYTNL